MPLIEHARRRIKLTEAGEAACAYYREILALEEVFRSRLADLKSIRTGRVQLAVGEAFITMELSAVLRDFMAQNSGLTVGVRVSATEEAITLVRNDEAHFGIIFDQPHDPRLSARLSFRQPLLALVAPGHPLARRRHLSFSDLRDVTVGVPEDSFRIRKLVRSAEHQEGIYLKAGLIANSLTLLKDYARDGRGLTILPAFLAKEEIQSGRLLAISIDNEILASTAINLIMLKGREMPNAVYSLLPLVESYLRSLTGEAA